MPFESHKTSSVDSCQHHQYAPTVVLCFVICVPVSLCFCGLVFLSFSLCTQIIHKMQLKLI